MRPIDAVPGEPLDWPRVAPARFDGCLHDRLHRLEIRLMGTGHDETGTTGRAAEIWPRTTQESPVEANEGASAMRSQTGRRDVGAGGFGRTLAIEPGQCGGSAFCVLTMWAHKM
jgi:hypothetical protein